ncbi:MAG: glucose-6-phosphate dehydrogenase [Planctomycetes bacterium]|nr:glucose-6-phosphate dehydrogenase [Planctomycetota bacterium]
MKRIEAVLKQQEILCAETPAEPCGIVVFGASGDLAHRKLFPGLFGLYTRDLLSRHFYCLGCGRSDYSEDAFRQTVRNSLMNSGQSVDARKVDDFLRRIYYVSGNYTDDVLYERLREKLTELDAAYEVDGVRIFYLSVPPFLYSEVTEKLGTLKLSCPGATGRLQQVRLVIEKPFGRDLESARELENVLLRHFNESQIYRIDHYLGKETVQNLLVFRFANSLFEPVWNRNYVDHIQITIAETLGVEHRAGFYDSTGALRDMFQNHLLQLLAMVAKEPPVSFEADSVRDEKNKVLRALRKFRPEQTPQFFVRGQYGPGQINGQVVKGYVEEEGVSRSSQTETFVAARVFVDNWRWKDVPFYLRTGKRLKRRLTEIAVVFKQVPHSMFMTAGLEDMPPNVIRFQIQPDEGVYLSLQAKRPGSKLCMGTLEMAVDYQEVFGVKMPDAYQRLLLDCIVGDQTLFTRHDSVLASWEFLEPVLEYWQSHTEDLVIYPAGSSSFKQASDLIVSDGRAWRKL